MKLSLNVFERLSVLQTLPPSGNFITMKIVRDLQDKLSFTEEEIKELEIKERNDAVSWNPKGNEPKEIEIGEKAMDIVVDSFKKMDEEGKLTLRTLPLYEKLVVESEKS